MATIAENLQTLNETKTEIKTAIESKGQDMTDVPFTSYADKITAIESGEKERSLKKLLDVTKTCANMFNKITSTDEYINSLFEYNDTENVTTMQSMFSFQGGTTWLKNAPAMNTPKVTDMSYMFRHQLGLEKSYPYDTKNVTTMRSMYDSANIKEFPPHDTSKVTNMEAVCSACYSLETLPLLNTPKVTTFYLAFMGAKIEEFPALDFRSCTNAGSVFNKCEKVKNIWIKNIKTSLSVGGGAGGGAWGHLLTQESALSLCFQCRNTGATKTITFAAPVFDNLATLYVKYVDITEEMRADDDLIDEKYPFVLCESTDEGAMTIATYMTNKMWAIARG